jgi:hypothetical protein
MVLRGAVTRYWGKQAVSDFQGDIGGYVLSTNWIALSLYGPLSVCSFTATSRPRNVDLYLLNGIWKDSVHCDSEEEKKHTHARPRPLAPNELGDNQQ